MTCQDECIMNKSTSLFLNPDWRRKRIYKVTVELCIIPAPNFKLQRSALSTLVQGATIPRACRFSTGSLQQRNCYFQPVQPVSFSYVDHHHPSRSEEHTSEL